MKQWWPNSPSLFYLWTPCSLMLIYDNSTQSLLKCLRPIQWCHNEREGISNHQPYDCLLNRLFRSRSIKTSKFRVTGLCAENSPVNFPHKGPVTRKMFHFDDVIIAPGDNVVMPNATSWNMHVISLSVGQSNDPNIWLGKGLKTKYPTREMFCILQYWLKTFGSPTLPSKT